MFTIEECQEVLSISQKEIESISNEIQRLKEDISQLESESANL